jgi:amino acid transporter
VNIFRSQLLAHLNNVSVWWHVGGAAAVILILALLPSDHQSPAWVFTTRINNSGYGEGFYWILVLPLGFLLTQYTITGYDASAHLSEETHHAADAAARGIWQSIFYSAIGGWVLLLAFLFAVQDEAAVTKAGGSVAAIFTQALTSGWSATVLGIAAIGQFFCSMASMTSTSRMLFAFSRDGAVPGSRLWSRLSERRVPANAVLVAALVAFVLTLPALVRVDINGAPVPVAFYAVVSIAVIGLYLSFLIPIWLRLRAGDAFTPGPWTLGAKHRWMGWVAVIEIVVISVYALLPLTPAGVPGNEAFGLEFVNYAPIVTGGTLLLLWIGWHASVKHWFTGPRTTIET